MLGYFMFEEEFRFRRVFYICFGILRKLILILVYVWVGIVWFIFKLRLGCYL